MRKSLNGEKEAFKKLKCGGKTKFLRVARNDFWSDDKKCFVTLVVLVIKVTNYAKFKWLKWQNMECGLEGREFKSRYEIFILLLLSQYSLPIFGTRPLPVVC